MILNTNWRNCYGTMEVVCPFCGEEHTDSWELNDSDTVDCDCGGRYEVQRERTISYITKPVGVGEWEKGDEA